MAGFGGDLDRLVAHAQKLDALLLDVHDTGVGVALEVGLGLEPVEDANEVPGWVEGGLVVDDHAAALIDGGVPAADGEVGLFNNLLVCIAIRKSCHGQDVHQTSPPFQSSSGTRPPPSTAAARHHASSRPRGTG